MTGNRIFITGGGSGIGLALVKAFMEKGNTVIVCGRNPGKLDEARKQFPSLHTFCLDVRDTSGAERIKGELESKFGGINVLINNAAVNHRFYFKKENSPLDEIGEEIDINLTAPLELTKIFMPMLLKEPEAAVVNITSVLSIFPLARRPFYSASKAGLRSFSKALRAQLEGTSVKVFEVLPPTVDTEMVKDTRRFKMPPDKLAAAVLRGLEKDRFEMMPGFTAFFYTLHRFFPNLVEYVVNHWTKS